ncbi:MAG: hypothetical protein QOH86_2037 [Sphingomonadales bacterium]|nr:hypothetical protein [Sphingomonadales bacterium]
MGSEDVLQLAGARERINATLSSEPRELVFTAPGEIVVRAVAAVAPGPGEVRVATLLSGMSHGTEINLLRGSAPGFHRRWDKRLRAFRDEPAHKSYPVAPGYECVGIVVELGEGVAGASPGDLVWLDRPHRSEHIVPTAEVRAGRLPEGMTPEQGIFCALTRVALGGVHDADIRLGDRVAIVGGGTIGLIAGQLARLNGARDVYVIERSEMRRGIARALGLIAVEPDEGGGAIEVKEACGGADVAIDTSGAYSGLHQAIAACAPGGIVVAVSSYQGEGAGLRLGEEFHRNRITLRSSMTVNGAEHRAHPRWDLDRLNRTARQLLAERSIEVGPLLSHVYPLEAAAEAYRLAQDAAACVKIAFSYEAR